MVDGLIFANTRAKAKENGLFTQERLNRMLDCQNIDEAVKILYEVSYGGGIILNRSSDFDELLKAEEKLACDFLKEIKIEGIGLDCFLLKRDYHNIKAMVKAKYNDLTNYDYMLTQEGVYSIDKLKTDLSNEKAKVNPHLDVALHYIKKQADIGKLSPREIDIEIDKALFQDLKERMEEVKDVDVRKYFTALADCTNISIYLRTIKINESFKFFALSFVEGGSITQREFEKWFEQGEEAFKKGVRGYDYSLLLELIEDGELSRFEAAVDNYLIKIFQEKSGDIFTTSPIISYYLQKINEIKVIRIVLVCIKNKVSREEIKKRLRVIYA